jgi:DNA-3-methyladenine glycosylase II
VNGTSVDVAVSQRRHKSGSYLQVHVRGSAPFDSSTVEGEVTNALKRLLGLDIDLSPLYEFAADEPHLATTVDRFRGVKPPRFLTLFEGLSNAVACQQLSLEVGLQLLNRMAMTFGQSGPSGSFAFPEPREVATADLADLVALGFSRQKADALVGLARSIEQGSLSLAALSPLDNASAAAALQQHRGIGRWSAEYVLLRVLGRTDVFPGDDVGARNKLQQWLSLPNPPSYEEINAILARWYPFAGLVYFHLLLDGLSISEPI